jgi:hypothetical protein
MSDGKTYRIKPLVWELVTASSCWESYEARIAFGNVRAEGYPNTREYAFVDNRGKRTCFDSLTAAKAAAEAWYRNKLLEALEEVA